MGGGGIPGSQLPYDLGAEDLVGRRLSRQSTKWERWNQGLGGLLLPTRALESQHHLDAGEEPHELMGCQLSSISEDAAGITDTCK